MMPGPYHEYGRQQSADRVEQAYRDGLAKQARKAKGNGAQRSVTGLLITWAVFMTCMVGLWVWLGM